MADHEARPKRSGGQSRSAMRRKARSLALQALYSWQIAGQPLSDIEAQLRSDPEYDFDSADGAYFRELLRGVPAHLDEIDEQLKQVLDRSVAEVDPIELAILRIGVFEMTQRIDVPYKVVINEGIEMAKVFGATDGHKYVNGILDKLAPRLRSVEVNASRRGR
ncbi:N utilization substance protein B [Halopseudomonas pertucinogena]|uniref:Transcription antitermination protein NusB n=2 Tax=Halopseudomonas pertucinogena TaxID=86175 RepID=A0ABQ2CU17_9GAMM|nr:N utilization substance protein B [Halopseudomonas pertucinogena]